MIVKNFVAKDHFKIVSSWWKSHGWPALSAEHLPKTGIIIFDGMSPVCCGWLYTTDSLFSLLEWVVSDPQSDFETRDIALDLLFETLLSKAPKNSLVAGLSLNKRLSDRYIKHGFHQADQKLNLLTFLKGDR